VKLAVAVFMTATPRVLQPKPGAVQLRAAQMMNLVVYLDLRVIRDCLVTQELVAVLPPVVPILTVILERYVSLEKCAFQLVEMEVAD
jgi:hypothetical protein